MWLCREALGSLGRGPCYGVVPRTSQYHYPTSNFRSTRGAAGLGAGSVGDVPVTRGQPLQLHQNRPRFGSKGADSSSSELSRATTSAQPTFHELVLGRGCGRGDVGAVPRRHRGPAKVGCGAPSRVSTLRGTAGNGRVEGLSLHHSLSRLSTLTYANSTKAQSTRRRRGFR